jgi:hypothetical protein
VYFVIESSNSGEEMKVKLERSNTDDGNLVFTLTVSDPKYALLKQEENQIMGIVDQCQKNVDIIDSNEPLRDSVVNILQKAKSKAFERVLNQIKSSIDEDLDAKIKPIRQEIYNWMYDHESNPMKKWMQDLDPQRTKYYFDNDITAESNHVPQESEHEEDDEEGWEED